MKFLKLLNFAVVVSALAWTPGDLLAQSMIYTKKNLEWQETCIQKHLYERPSRTTSLGRFGIKLEIPANYDFDLDAKNTDEVYITRIKDLAAIRCYKLAKNLHNIELPGGGMSTIMIAERKRLPDETNDFENAVIVLGKKAPIYTERGGYWISFYNPKINRPIHISWDANLEDFLKLLRSIQLD